MSLQIQPKKYFMRNLIWGGENLTSSNNKKNFVHKKKVKWIMWEFTEICDNEIIAIDRSVVQKAILIIRLSYRSSSKRKRGTEGDWVENCTVKSFKRPTLQQNGKPIPCCTSKHSVNNLWKNPVHLGCYLKWKRGAFN